MPIFILPTCNLRRAFLVVEAVFMIPQPPDKEGPPEGQQVDVLRADLWRPSDEPPTLADWFIRKGAIRRIDWEKMDRRDREGFEEEIIKQGGRRGH